MAVLTPTPDKTGGAICSKAQGLLDCPSVDGQSRTFRRENFMHTYSYSASRFLILKRFDQHNKVIVTIFVASCKTGEPPAPRRIATGGLLFPFVQASYGDEACRGPQEIISTQMLGKSVD